MILFFKQENVLKKSSVTPNNDIFAVLQHYVDMETMYWIDIYMYMPNFILSAVGYNTLLWKNIQD